ncbi:hypothetical protein BDP27DRAFT_1370441 [Rhodocollybia butyracea]|uniref:Uncharacterized protein n=1 Tax=Rhodocollybia butyracea TaxID=206335 RepID=A0A9P5P936_9AGAR|nr:hypothetical protein BDP27DRAFT_1370441 [Rhodocollybia butyracea]
MSSDSENIEKSKNISKNIENNKKIENSDDIYRVFYDVNGTLERNPVIYRRDPADVEQTDISVYNVSAEDFKAIQIQAKRDSAVTLPTNGLIVDEDEIGKHCLVVLQDLYLLEFVQVGHMDERAQVRTLSQIKQHGHSVRFDKKRPKLVAKNVL